MPAIPAEFRAFVVDKVGDAVERGVRDLRRGRPAAGRGGDPGRLVERQLQGRAGHDRDGKVARISPLIPGIDLAGTVVESEDPAFAAGSAVLAHGYDLGVARHGGYAEYARVPAGWVVPLPPGLTAREAMAMGTAGFTAALSVARLEARGLGPADGPVLVTGASGGVGRTATAILVERGYEVWAATGKTAVHDDLRALGAAGILSREEVTADEPAPSRERALGGRGRLRRCGDPAVHPAHPALGRGGRGQRQHRRGRIRDDRLPVHPARRGPARDRLGPGPDRGASVAVGPDRRRSPAA